MRKRDIDRMIAKLDEEAKKLSEQRQKIADDCAALDEATKLQRAVLEQRRREVNVRVVRLQEAAADSSTSTPEAASPQKVST